MKHLYIPLLVLFACSVLSCSKEQQEINCLGRTVVVTAEYDDTKTACDISGESVSISWNNTNDDFLHLYENNVLGTNPKVSIASPKSATFSATFSDAKPEPSSYKYHALISGAVTDSKPLIPSTQYPTSSSFDPAADILIGREKTFDNPQNNITLQFGRIAALSRLSFSGIDETLMNEPVMSVTITASNSIAGYACVENFSFGAIAYDQEGGSDVITLSYPDGLPIVDNKFDAYVVTFPVKPGSSTVCITTSGHKLLKNLDFKDRAFSLDKFSDISIDMSSVKPISKGSEEIGGRWSDKGAYDISWYDPAKNEYELSTARQLAGLAYLVNNNYTSFKGVKFSLASNISLKGKEWVPVGISNMLFYGSLNGNGFSIKNVSISGTGLSSNYGFFTSLNNSTIENLTINGDISSTQKYVGLISYGATGATFRNININGTVTFDKQTSVGVSSTTKLGYDIGGGLGWASKCTFENINVKSIIKFEIGSPSGNNMYGLIDVYAGGIVGSATDCKYERCKTEIDCKIGVNGVVTDRSYSSVGTGNVYFGGIAGKDDGSNTFIRTCYSKINNFSGNHYNGTYDYLYFQCAGMIGLMDRYECNAEIKNCVSITKIYSVKGHDYSWVSTGYHTHSRYCGITCYTPKNIGGCYSNNDVNITESKVTKSTGECGTTTFSSEEMKTSEFLDELNLYPLLNFGQKTWGLDDNGELIFLE